MNGQSEEPRIVGSQELFAFVRDVLAQAGVPQPEAATVAEVLLTANLSGIDTHGVVRLGHYLRRLENGTINPTPQIGFEKKAGGLGIVDANHGFGHVAMLKACGWAAELCRESGIASVAVKNSSHFGMAGFYVLKMIEEGFAAMVMTPSDAFLIPFGARRSFFGTNPVAIGFPTGGIPLVLDMATTMVPYGKVVLAQKEGKPIPPDWGFDETGAPTADADRVAGLHPIAGPKGSGLAMIIDIFCCLLAGMPFGPHIPKMYGDMAKRRELSHFVALWDIDRLVPIETFKERLAGMIEELHDLPPADGFSRVYFPGEVEGLRRQERTRDGVPIEPGLFAELRQLSERCDVPFMV